MSRYKTQVGGRPWEAERRAGPVRSREGVHRRAPLLRKKALNFWRVTCSAHPTTARRRNVLRRMSAEIIPARRARGTEHRRGSPGMLLARKSPSRAPPASVSSSSPASAGPLRRVADRGRGREGAVARPVGERVASALGAGETVRLAAGGARGSQQQSNAPIVLICGRGARCAGAWPPAPPVTKRWYPPAATPTRNTVRGPNTRYPSTAPPTTPVSGRDVPKIATRRSRSRAAAVGVGAALPAGPCSSSGWWRPSTTMAQGTMSYSRGAAEELGRRWKTCR